MTTTTSTTATLTWPSMTDLLRDGAVRAWVAFKTWRQAHPSRKVLRQQLEETQASRSLFILAFTEACRQADVAEDQRNELHGALECMAQLFNTKGDERSAAVLAEVALNSTHPQRGIAADAFIATGKANTEPVKLGIGSVLALKG